MPIIQSITSNIKNITTYKPAINKTIIVEQDYSVRERLNSIYFLYVESNVGLKSVFVYL